MLSHWPNERAMVTYPFVWWDGVFTSDELDAIVAMCAAHESEVATTLGKNDDWLGEKRRRNSRVQFHKLNDDTARIFQKLDVAITSINDRWYNFRLNGYESFQYTEYNGDEKGHYGWHMDICLGNDHLPSEMIQPRKLSLSLLLNEPGVDFEGGDLQINVGNQERGRTPLMKRGRIIAFPSWMIHRVTPVTKGTRKSLVVWVVGPKFK